MDCATLNNAELSLFSDLILGSFAFDRGTRGYRLIKNAVLLLSRGDCTVSEVYPFIAKTADISTERARTEIDRAIAALPEPMHVTFNAHYAPPLLPYERRELSVTMPEYTSADDILSFLGTTLMYLLMTNYPQYA